MENARAAQASGSTVARLVQQQALAFAASPPADKASSASPPGNSVRTVFFGFGSTRVGLSAADLAKLADEARSAPLIVLRGRTDGMADSPAESRIARQRAEAVRGLLLQSGVDPARIRTTWQPSGDQVADNGSAAGRSLNRRVEIEIYRSVPRAVALGLPPSPAAPE